MSCKVNWMISVTAIMVLGLLSAVSSASAGIVNGSFEDGGQGNGLGMFPGWNATANVNGNISYIYDGRGPGWWADLGSPGSEGLKCAVLQAEAHVTGPSTPPSVNLVEVELSQSFSATAGQYVTFDYYLPSCSASGGGMGNAFAYLSVTLQGDGYYEGFNQKSISSGYATFVTFPAFTGDGNYTIHFLAHANACTGFWGQEPNTPGIGDASVEAIVDNVQLVPEPSSLALLGISALGLLALAWRKRNAVA